MGFNLKSVAGPLGAGLGQVIGGPVGAILGGAMGGSIQSSYENEKQYGRDKELMNYQMYRNEKLQKEFAQKGIQWKVKDAEKAGIHPLAALGGSTHSPSSAFVGGASPLVNRSGDMAELGQNISRAAAATATEHQRKIMDLQLENMQYDNEMKEMEVISARRNLENQIPPGLHDSVKTVPVQVKSSVKGRPEVEAGTIPNLSYARTKGGGLMPVQSSDFKDRTEDSPGETLWSLKNYIGPSLGDMSNKPPKKYLPKGFKDWEWNISDISWMPVKRKAQTPFKRLGKKWHKKFKKRKGSLVPSSEQIKSWAKQK